MEQESTAKHSGEPNPVDSTGLCLLSLDGGGVRGLSSLYILKSIMDRLNHAREQDKLPRVKPCEVFDLIGGTSTGGLIAIMLGRLEMEVDECIDAYSNLATSVFRERLRSIPFNFKGDISARFDSAKLESVIQRVIENSGASKQELFNDGTERGCRTFVCTADRHTKDIVRLRSYCLPHEPNINATICQAALATSAATTFFEPVNIGDRSFADGGLGANNPVDEVESEASNIWCHETGDLKELVKCFISIGTGNPGKKPFEKSMMKFLGQTVVHIATETENTEKRFIGRWARHFDKKRYFRFNVEQGLQEIGMEEYNKKGAIAAATESYLTHIEQKFRVRDCIKNMRLKQNKPGPSFPTIVHEYTIHANRQESAPHRTPWIVPFERNPRFTAREPQLVQLEEMLSADDRTAKIAIVGLGGVGKTHLVLELLFRIKEKHPTLAVVWIPASNMESLHQAYLNAAQQLGIPRWEDSKEDVKCLLQEYLGRESSGRWLLVFDNADDRDMWIAKPESGLEARQGSRPLIDYLPKSNQGAILFTTRDRKLAVKLAQQNVVEVPAMEEGAAAQLLGKCLVDPKLVNSKEDTSAMLSQLTYLPLAIVQAAAYINENGIAIADYLYLLAEQEEEVIDLLSEEFEDDGRYSDVKNPVATTWLISFEQIRRRDPLAADYLSFMACVEPKSIPQSLLPPGPTRKKEIDAIGTLNAYSFVTRRPADMVLDLHRLVHLATRNWLRMEEQLSKWSEKVIMRLDEVFPSHNHENRSLWRSYLTHCRYALQSGLVDKDWETRIDLMWRYTMCLYQDGWWDETETSIIQILDTDRKDLGADHPSTLACMAILASTFREQGRLKAAENLFVQVIETLKGKQGADHPSTLDCIANLASTYRFQGRWEAAEELDMQVIKTCKEKLGADYIAPLSSIANLAAEELPMQVIETHKEKLEADHPDRLTNMAYLASRLLFSMANLASTYRNQGRWKAAEELDMQVLERLNETKGADHPDTLVSMANLASTFWKQGRWEDAEVLFVQVIETRKKKLGADHPSTLVSMANLASTFWKQGRWEAAEVLFVQVIETSKKKLGADHPDTLVSMSNLASTYGDRGRWEAAEVLFMQVIESRKKRLGEDHPSTLTSLSNLAATWKGQGRTVKAMHLMRECVQRQKRVLGDNHPDSISSSNVLARWEAEEGQLAAQLQV
ncbi:FabD/lysophospholipase-like protein [Aspergillus terreus]|uniref:FabD/lysophospholipase-like protein n=1 Tax=Aspergillus terreus TaxID=33178 RepID=A0A5M3YM14_ASPTE|nr:hypothetical protein ATETN484_0001011300 [Aspergillus terreus]GFF11894.1 FabD/lysophospholipase-like protein [Aspergillus terreus]